MGEVVINQKFLRAFGSLYVPRFSFWLFAVVTLSVALPVHSDPIVWNAATQFWWNGKTAADSPNGNGLADWTDGVKAAERQSGSATSSFGSSWSYGLINCNGTALVGTGPVLDPWPDTITRSYAQRLEGEVEWDANRDPHMQFSDITDTGSGLYNSTVPSWVYRSSDVQIGWSSSTSAGAVLPNTEYVHMQPSFGGNNYYGHPSDGLAPALRWTAPVGGTYRFQGEFLPSGSGLGTMSYAILTANNPDFPDGSVPTLLSRATVGNQAVAISYDITTTVVTGQTVTWVVGTDGPGLGDSMEVMAKVTSVTLDTKISTVLSPTRSVAFPCDGVPHAPAVSVAGSSGLVIRSFAGVDGTTYDSSTPPTLKGKYSMTYSVEEDENYQAASINVPFTVGYWNAAAEFWWNAPSSEASSTAWAGGAVDAGFGGRTSQSQSLWSYGLLNTTGGDPANNDAYPTSITGTTGGPSSPRGAFGQFWDSTTSGSYTYAPIGAGGLYLYNFLGTQIGVYGTPWFNLAPGYDGAGAGRVGTPNLTHMWLKSSNTGAGSDGFASALRWTAPAAGTYRFYGEFVPGGVSPYEQSFAILKSSPAGANNSGDTALLSRSTVVDDGPVTSYDITATLAAGETVTWVVGTNGGPTNQMGVQAQVEFLGPPILTLSGAVEFNYTGSQQEPLIVKVGSTSTITKTFVGVGSTSYAASSTPPKNQGTYKVTSSVASDGTYGPATLDTNFTINPAQLTITATAASKNQGNPDPELIYEVSGLLGSDSLLVMTGELFRVPGEAPGTYAIQQGTLSAGGNYTISFNGALLTITGQSLESWSGGAPLTDDLLRKYVFGGASGPNAASEAPVYSLDGSTLSLTAIVRKNDPAIRVEGTFTTDLGNANSWSTSGVSSTTVGVDQNVPEGTERRKYSVERGSNDKKFLRLDVVTQ